MIFKQIFWTHRWDSNRYYYYTLLHSPERAAAGIGLHVNAYKTEYMCFDQTGNISILNGSTLKLIDKFINEAVSPQPRQTSTRD